MARCVAAVLSSIVLLSLTSTAIAASRPGGREANGGDVDDVSSLLQINQALNAPLHRRPLSDFFFEVSDSAKKPRMQGHVKNYKLSKPAAKFGITKSNAFLDGGAPEWPLFPKGAVPWESNLGGQSFGKTAPQGIVLQEVNAKCTPGLISGYGIQNVSEPSVVPFIVGKDVPGRKAAAVIIAPGGSGVFLQWNVDGTRIAKWLNTLGISAFVLKYRVPHITMDTAMKPLTDAQRAVSLVRSKASELGFDKVGFMGFSSGGSVAASLSMSPKSYVYLDDIDAHSSYPDFVLSIYGGGDGTAEHRAWDAMLLMAGPQTPPTFIAQAQDDPCIENNLALNWYQQLLFVSASYAGPSAEREHELHIYPAGKHGFGDCSMYVEGNKWQPACAWTLNAQVFIENQLGFTHELGPMKYVDGFTKDQI